MNKIIRWLNCKLFNNHLWGGKNNNTCVLCGKKAVGLPKYKNPFPVPKKVNKIY